MRLRSKHSSRASTTSSHSDRLSTLTIIVGLFGAMIIGRLFFLQVIQHGDYVALAEAQHELQTEIQPQRGNIFASSAVESGATFPLASNRSYGLLYAVPDDVENPEETAKKIRDAMPELDEAELIRKMSKDNDLYEDLAHKVPDETRNAIEDMGLKGIYFTDERIRYYPENNIGSHILGFVGFKDDVRVGQYGLEGEMNELLSGKTGYVKADRDASGRWIVIGTREFEQAEDGKSLVLTIDQNIQYTACTKLNEAVKKHGADGGSVVILNPKNGAVMAMCGSPDFDPNLYNEVDDISVYTNEVVSGAYEPGSVFKPLTMAAALNEEKVTPQTTYTDEGVVEIGQYSIRNSDDKAHGVQTMTQVLEESLNTGAIFAMRSIGPERFADYVYSFGFGEITGISLQGESAGNVSNLDLGGEIYAATGSFGQGITVTPLQLVSAYGAIANSGKLMKPNIIKEIRNPDGTVLQTFSEEEVRQVIRPDVAKTLSAMMVNVVENGHGKRAGVPGYYIAGKTGTAQVKSATGSGYDPNNTIGSFAGFGPVSDPAFVMVVRIDHPRDVTFAESTAAPLFGDIAKYLLHYLHIPPDRVE